LAAYSIWQQMEMHASFWEAVAITFLTFGTCVVQAQVNLHQNLLGLANRYVQAQRFALVASLVRLGLTAAILFWINPVLALLTSLAGSVLELVLKSRATVGLATFSAAPDREAGRGFKRLAFTLLPSTAFHIVQSNLPLIIPGLIGDNEHVAAFRADFTAISRLALPIGILSSLAAGFLMPHFAKLPAAELRPFLLKIVRGTGAFAVCVALGGWLFSDVLLWTIGPTYAHLGHELAFMLLLSAANFFIDTILALCQARAWLAHVWIGAAATLAVQIVFFRFFDLNTITGALGFSALSLIPRSLLVFCLCWRGLSGRGLLVKNAD
jgi:hypothetical protein